MSVNRRSLAMSGASVCLGLVLLEVYKHRLVVETAGGEPVRIVVAREDSQPGTVLTRDALGERAVPEAYVFARQVPLADVDKLVGGRLGTAVRAGDALLWTDLVPTSSSSPELSSLVRPGTRAVLVRAAAFAGLLRPGDHVDVLSAMPEEPNGADSKLLQNLLVLAVDGNTGRSTPDESTPPPGEGVTLAGTVEQAEALARANRAGEVTLALRNPGDTSLVERRRAALAPRLGASPRPPEREIEHVQ
jgi:pilus assembly protein CpaB